MSTSKITVETTINHTPEKVWEYWTDPKHITKWNFATDDWHCPKAENDLRPNGTFKINMAAKDGSMSFDLEGVYNDVLPKKKIAYTMTDGRQVDIEFEDLGNQTKVIETFDPENQNSEDMQRSGWQAILDNFKKYAETL